MKITHNEIENLASLQTHPGRKVIVSCVKEKVDQLSAIIDSLKTKDRDITYNNTEVTILRKSFLNEIVGLPEEITKIFAKDQDINNTNQWIQKWMDELEQD